MKLVSKEEVDVNSMQKNKILGLDGWTVYFFQCFFETLGDYWAGVFEDSSVKGTIYQNFNSTFLALIPNKDDPKSFKDLMPISL